jgi:hypothetical protein
MSFAGSAALFLLRIGIEGEEGTLSVASKSSVKSVERFEGDKAVASTMAVVFVVKWFFSEDDEAVASIMAVLFGVDLNNPEDNEAVASMPNAAPFVVDLLLFEDNELVLWQS